VWLISWLPLQALALHVGGATHEKLEHHHQHLSGWLPARNPRALRKLGPVERSPYHKVLLTVDSRDAY